MATRVGFGSVAVEASGFEPEPSQALPTLHGIVNGTVVWTLTLNREDMLRAYLIFNSFLRISSEAHQASGQVEAIRSVVPALSNMQNWMTEHLKNLETTGADPDSLRTIQRILDELSTLRQQLGSLGA